MLSYILKVIHNLHLYVVNSEITHTFILLNNLTSDFQPRIHGPLRGPQAEIYI